LGVCSRIRNLLDSEAYDDRGEVFIHQFRFAPSLAALPSHPNPHAAQNGEIDGEQECNLTGNGDHYRDDRNGHTEDRKVPSYDPDQWPFSGDMGTGEGQFLPAIEKAFKQPERRQ
jgi:hypothetical protein